MLPCVLKLLPFTGYFLNKACFANRKVIELNGGKYHNNYFIDMLQQMMSFYASLCIIDSIIIPHKLIAARLFLSCLHPHTMFLRWRYVHWYYTWPNYTWPNYIWHWPTSPSRTVLYTWTLVAANMIWMSCNDLYSK